MFNSFYRFFKNTYNYSSIRKTSNSNLQKLLESMPKEPEHVEILKKQRMKNRESVKRTVPGRIRLQILGAGTKGAPKALYMFTDQNRYLFNCGEGTQRLAHEHKLKLSRLEHIFLTNSTWENIGGLPGVALTIQDIGVPHITLHGPNSLEELFQATKKFVVLKNLEIRIADTENEFFEDNVMKVEYVPLVKDSECAEKLDRNKDPEQYNKKIYCYICHVHSRPGALSLEKCVELGVPTGPLLGKLKAGMDIELPSGKLIKSQDVCLPDEPGPVVIIVDCPTEEYLNDLVNRKEFQNHQAMTSTDNNLAYVVIHFTPSDIINSKMYQVWIDRFSPSTQHIVINDSNRCMGSMAVHRIQYKLNMLHENLFPLLGDDGTGSQTKNENLLESSSSNTIIESRQDMSVSSVSKNCLNANTLCNIHLRPKKGIDNSEEIRLEPSVYIKEPMTVEGFPEVFQELKDTLSKITLVNTKPYPRILFLGTGSCIPNKTRNTSAILLEISKDDAFLMDCGEGTYGQIVRFFGYERALKILHNIKAIFISHIHADHHIGLIGLLQGRQNALKHLKVPNNPVKIIAPHDVEPWLKFYTNKFENINSEFEIILNNVLLHTCEELSSEALALQEQLRMVSIQTTYVRHCPNAFGISFKHKDGWKITYSGDTMPCDRLVKIGLDSDLLIHEATMEDELIEEAITKMHSTTSQAIEIGQSMRAKYTLLTHFSQRYAKLPRFNENFTENVGIAFDNMQIRLGELPLISLLYPALKLMFAEQYEELEQKAVKRELKRGNTDSKRRKN